MSSAIVPYLIEMSALQRLNKALTSAAGVLQKPKRAKTPVLAPKTSDSIPNELVLKTAPAGGEAGAHWHVLDRDGKKTREDGLHSHLFALEMENGDMMLIATEVDGVHVHGLGDSGADATEADAGKHKHIVVLPDGTQVETGDEASGHNHVLQVAMTGFDGTHVHTLELPDGESVTSLTAGEFWRMSRELAKRFAGKFVGDVEHIIDVVKRIERRVEDGKTVYCVVAETTGRNFGCFSTKSAAEDRLAQVEQFSKRAPRDKPKKRDTSKEIPDSRPIRVIKTEELETPDEGEERIVFGVVLVPNEVDAQEDIYDEAEVRKAAFGFMEIYGGNLKLMHKGSFLEGQAVVIETYVSKQEETHGEEVFPTGTWFMTSRIVGDDLWGDVKKGVWTGYSIGGSAVREPLA